MAHGRFSYLPMKHGIFLAYLCSTFAALAAPIKVGNPKVENQVNPSGVSAGPRFSWHLISDERNKTQIAYQILAASSKELLTEEKADLWKGQLSSTGRFAFRTKRRKSESGPPTLGSRLGTKLSFQSRHAPRASKAAHQFSTNSTLIASPNYRPGSTNSRKAMSQRLAMVRNFSGRPASIFLTSTPPRISPSGCV